MTLTCIALLLTVLNVVFLLWAVFRLDRRTRTLQSELGAVETESFVQSGMAASVASDLEHLEARVSKLEGQSK